MYQFIIIIKIFTHCFFIIRKIYINQIISEFTTIKLTVDFEVQTYYPAYRKDPDPIIYPKGTKWYLQMHTGRSNKSNKPIDDASKLNKNG